MSVCRSISDVDYCRECGMDWHDDQRPNDHDVSCSLFHPAGARQVPPLPDEIEEDVDDGLPY